MSLKVVSFKSDLIIGKIWAILYGPYSIARIANTVWRVWAILESKLVSV